MEMKYEDLVKRINELSKLSRERALTNDEQVERQSLRQEYINRIKRSFCSQMDNTVIVDEKTGKKTKVVKKEKVDGKETD